MNLLLKNTKRTNSSAVCTYPLHFSSPLAPGGSCHLWWPWWRWRPCTGCCFLWWPWWRQWLRLSRCRCPLTHLDPSSEQPYCIHVAHFVVLSCRSIFHLCLVALSSIMRLTVSETRRPVWETIHFFSNFFSLRVDLDLISRQRLGGVVFIYSVLFETRWQLSCD